MRLPYSSDPRFHGKRWLDAVNAATANHIDDLKREVDMLRVSQGLPQKYFGQGSRG